MVSQNLFCINFPMNWWEYFFLKDKFVEVEMLGQKVCNI